VYALEETDPRGNVKQDGAWWIIDDGDGDSDDNGDGDESDNDGDGDGKGKGWRMPDPVDRFPNMRGTPQAAMMTLGRWRVLV
jgi:hypothetical protein